MCLLSFLKVVLPSGKLSHNYGKSPCSMGKFTISMAIFNSNLLVITRGYIPLNPIKPPFSYGFPMVFQISALGEESSQVTGSPSEAAGSLGV